MLVAAVAFLYLSGASIAQAQVNNQLGATWIPTDLNYGVITALRKNNLTSPAEQIAGTENSKPSSRAVHLCGSLHESNVAMRHGLQRCTETLPMHGFQGAQ